jgi:Domain of unknown function (DUF1772)
MTLELLLVVTDLVHMIAVGALGLFAGAMLTEAGVLVPYWRSVDAGTFQAWYRGNAERLVRFFGGLTWCAGLSSLAWALLASAASKGGQAWAVTAAGLIVGAVAMFPLFFKQANAGFLAGGRSNDEMARALRQWARWHWVRTGISLGAFAAAVAAP